jgi:hypothetical protein
MSKAKAKCPQCGKMFKQTKSSQLYCDDCERKRRQQKAAQPAPKPAATAATGEKPVWLKSATVRDEHTPYTSVIDREEKPKREPRPEVPVSRTPQPRGARSPRSPGAPKPPQKPRPPRVITPPTPPFEPTPEQIAAIEARYLELAQPEYNGIRTQIAREMEIPRVAVKRVVAALREREKLPSWWDAAEYSGTPENLERIRVAYMPLLPTPPVGVHKQIAKELDLPPIDVYRGIGAIRKAMGLPVFNPPETHPELPYKGVAPDTAAAEGSAASVVEGSGV